MKVLAITNLLPRPDEPTRGMYNAQTLEHLAGLVDLQVLGLVPDWRPWMWTRIRRGVCPHVALRNCTRYIPALYVPRIGRDRSWHTYEWSMVSAREQFREADVVFSSWLYPDGVAATRLAAAYGKPAWMMALGSDTFHLQHKLRRRAIVRASRDAAGIICVCQLLADRLADAGVAPTKLHVVPNGVDPELFRLRAKADAVAELLQVGGMSMPPVLSDGGKIILFVGNLVPVKGPDLMLNAFERLVNIPTPTHPRTATLVFIGDGFMRGELELTARRMGVADHVCFIGRRPHDEIASWMNVADCLCLSSRSEGMPNVVLEALACGVPVVATDVGACAEMLVDADRGTVVPVGDVDALARALALECDQSEDGVARAQRVGARSWGDQAVDVLRLITRKER